MVWFSFFTWLNDIPLCTYTTSALFIHLSIIFCIIITLFPIFDYWKYAVMYKGVQASPEINTQDIKYIFLCSKLLPGILYYLLLCSHIISSLKDISVCFLKISILSTQKCLLLHYFAFVSHFPCILSWLNFS